MGWRSDGLVLEGPAWNLKARVDSPAPQKGTRRRGKGEELLAVQGGGPHRLFFVVVGGPFAFLTNLLSMHFEGWKVGPASIEPWKVS